MQKKIGYLSILFTVATFDHHLGSDQTVIGDLLYDKCLRISPFLLGLLCLLAVFPTTPGLHAAEDFEDL